MGFYFSGKEIFSGKKSGKESARLVTLPFKT